MADFRARPIDPALLQQLIAAKSQSPVSSALGGLSKGLDRGRALAESIAKVRTQRQKQKLINAQIAGVEQDTATAAFDLEQEEKLAKTLDNIINPNQVAGEDGKIPETNTGINLTDSQRLAANLIGDNKEKAKYIAKIANTPSKEEKLADDYKKIINKKKAEFVASQDPEVKKAAQVESDRKIAAMIDISQRKADIQVDKEKRVVTEKNIAKSKQALQTVRNKTRVFMGGFKGWQKSIGINEDDPGYEQKLKSLWGNVKGIFGENEFSKPLKGLTVEIATALAKLAAPSARIGKDMIRIFRETIPDNLSPTNEGLQQLRFSLHNAVSAALASESIEYTDEQKKAADDIFVEMMSMEPFETIEELNNAHLGNIRTIPMDTSNLPIQGEITDEDLENLFK